VAQSRQSCAVELIRPSASLGEVEHLGDVAAEDFVLVGLGNVQAHDLLHFEPGVGVEIGVLVWAVGAPDHSLRADSLHCFFHLEDERDGAQVEVGIVKALGDLDE